MATQRTDTPGVYRRGPSYAVKWWENGRRQQRTFPTYEAACAFRRDAVEAHRAGLSSIPASVRLPKRGPKFIYVLQSSGSDGVVKLGWTSDLAKRIRDLRALHPHELELVAAFPGPRELERCLHERLERWRTRGEWYRREAVEELTTLLLGLLEEGR